MGVARHPGGADSVDEASIVGKANADGAPRLC